MAKPPGKKRIDEIVYVDEDEECTHTSGPPTVHTISKERKRERSPSSQGSMFNFDANNLEQFLRVASPEFTLRAVSEYNAEVKCSCFSCCANKFLFTANPVNGACTLRPAVIERLKVNHCEMYNLLDNLGVVHTSRLVYTKPDASHGVGADETYPDIDAHIVESYRAPGADETFQQYVESGNYWKLIGFGQRICDCGSVDYEGILQWRNFIMHMFEVRNTPFMVHTYHVLKPLTRVLWPQLVADAE
jgi:hypothetical protein